MKLNIDKLSSKSLKSIRDFIVDNLKNYEIEGDVQFILKLVVDEACQNIIRHSYQGKELPLEVECYKQENTVTVKLRDFSSSKTSLGDLKPRPLEDVRPGGLGTRFILENMSRVYFQDGIETGNCLVIEKDL